MEKANKNVEFETVVEEGMNIKVNKSSLSPKRDDAFYDKNIKPIRSLVTSALGCLSKDGLPGITDNRKILCLDGIGGTGISGLLWKKYIGENIQVTVNDPHETSFNVIAQNAEHNGIKIEISNEDPCTILHRRPFHFIYLDCHTSASHYFDAAFRSMVKGGIFAITTKDDCALYGRNPDVALRSYGGRIGKTMYAKELALRLIIAGMVRSAAKYNKGLKVLCTTAVKSSLTIIVSVTKGSADANACVENLQVLAHCSMCEDRAFLPQSNYVLENPLQLVVCGCQGRLPGQFILQLGPLWSGPLWDPQFLLSLLQISTSFPWQKQLTDFIRPIMFEAWCPTIDENRFWTKVQEYIKDKNGTKEINGSENEAEPPAKRSKPERTPLELKSPPAPAFYFNLHHHSPKGPQVLPADKVVETLHKEGHRASRTHFDPMAVRTSTSLQELVKILSPSNVIEIK